MDKLNTRKKMRFKDYVIKKNLSLRQASALFGINIGTACHLYHGKNTPAPKIIKAVVLKSKWMITPEDLLDLKRPKNIPEKIVLD
jgi:hypothetical protein